MAGAGLASSTSFSERIKLLHENLFVDAVFNEQQWKDHRSTWKRHRIENYGLRTAAVFAGFFWQILLIEFVAVLVCIYSTVLVRIGCPPIPSSYYNVFALLTFSLSLLLVFKTNSSFSRWWEGRGEWPTQHP
jgi:putative membrane protein